MVQTTQETPEERRRRLLEEFYNGTPTVDPASPEAIPFPDLTPSAAPQTTGDGIPAWAAGTRLAELDPRPPSFLRRTAAKLPGQIEAQRGSYLKTAGALTGNEGLLERGGDLQQKAADQGLFSEYRDPTSALYTDFKTDRALHGIKGAVGHHILKRVINPNWWSDLTASALPSAATSMSAATLGASMGGWLGTRLGGAAGAAGGALVGTAAGPAGTVAGGVGGGLAGARGGGLLGAKVGGLIGGALGVAADVFAQLYGDSYVQYKDANAEKGADGITDPEELEIKARSFALKKAGGSAILNSLGIGVAAGAALRGVGRAGQRAAAQGAQKKMLSDMARAAGLSETATESADNILSNALDKAYIDPDTPLFQNWLEAGVGGALFDAPGAYIAGQAARAAAEDRKFYGDMFENMKRAYTPPKGNVYEAEQTAAGTGDPWTGGQPPEWGVAPEQAETTPDVPAETPGQDVQEIGREFADEKAAEQRVRTAAELSDFMDSVAADVFDGDDREGRRWLDMYYDMFIKNAYEGRDPGKQTTWQKDDVIHAAHFIREIMAIEELLTTPEIEKQLRKHESWLKRDHPNMPQEERERRMFARKLRLLRREFSSTDEKGELKYAKAAQQLKDDIQKYRDMTSKAEDRRRKPYRAPKEKPPPKKPDLESKSISDYSPKELAETGPAGVFNMMVQDEKNRIAHEATNADGELTISPEELDRRTSEAVLELFAVDDEMKKIDIDDPKYDAVRKSFRNQVNQALGTKQGTLEDERRESLYQVYVDEFKRGLVEERRKREAQVQEAPVQEAPVEAPVNERKDEADAAGQRDLEDVVQESKPDDGDPNSVQNQARRYFSNQDSLTERKEGDIEKTAGTSLNIKTGEGTPIITITVDGQQYYVSQSIESKVPKLRTKEGVVLFLNMVGKDKLTGSYDESFDLDNIRDVFNKIKKAEDESLGVPKDAEKKAAVKQEGKALFDRKKREADARRPRKQEPEDKDVGGVPSDRKILNDDSLKPNKKGEIDHLGSRKMRWLFKNHGFKRIPDIPVTSELNYQLASTIYEFIRQGFLDAQGRQEGEPSLELLGEYYSAPGNPRILTHGEGETAQRVVDSLTNKYAKENKVEDKEKWAAMKENMVDAIKNRKLLTAWREAGRPDLSGFEQPKKEVAERDKSNDLKGGRAVARKRAQIFIDTYKNDLNIPYLIRDFRKSSQSREIKDKLIEDIGNALGREAVDAATMSMRAMKKIDRAQRYFGYFQDNVFDPKYDVHRVIARLEKIWEEEGKAIDEVREAENEAARGDIVQAEPLKQDVVKEETKDSPPKKMVEGRDAAQERARHFADDNKEEIRKLRDEFLNDPRSMEYKESLLNEVESLLFGWADESKKEDDRGRYKRAMARLQTFRNRLRGAAALVEQIERQEPKKRTRKKAKVEEKQVEEKPVEEKPVGKDLLGDSDALRDNAQKLANAFGNRDTTGRKLFEETYGKENLDFRRHVLNEVDKLLDGRIRRARSDKGRTRAETAKKRVAAYIDFIGDEKKIFRFREIKERFPDWEFDTDLIRKYRNFYSSYRKGDGLSHRDAVEQVVLRVQEGVEAEEMFLEEQVRESEDAGEKPEVMRFDRKHKIFDSVRKDFGLFDKHDWKYFDKMYRDILVDLNKEGQDLSHEQILKTVLETIELEIADRKKEAEEGTQEPPAETAEDEAYLISDKEIDALLKDIDDDDFDISDIRKKNLPVKVDPKTEDKLKTISGFQYAKESLTAFYRDVVNDDLSPEQRERMIQIVGFLADNIVQNLDRFKLLPDRFKRRIVDKLIMEVRKKTSGIELEQLPDPRPFAERMGYKVGTAVKKVRQAIREQRRLATSDGPDPSRRRFLKGVAGAAAKGAIPVGTEKVVGALLSGSSGVPALNISDDKLKRLELLDFKKYRALRHLGEKVVSLLSNRFASTHRNKSQPGKWDSIHQSLGIDKDKDRDEINKYLKSDDYMPEQETIHDFYTGEHYKIARQAEMIVRRALAGYRRKNNLSLHEPPTQKELDDHDLSQDDEDLLDEAFQEYREEQALEEALHDMQEDGYYLDSKDVWWKEEKDGSSARAENQEELTDQLEDLKDQKERYFGQDDEMYNEYDAHYRNLSFRREHDRPELGYDDHPALDKMIENFIGEVENRITKALTVDPRTGRKARPVSAPNVKRLVDDLKRETPSILRGALEDSGLINHMPRDFRLEGERRPAPRLTADKGETPTLPSRRKFLRQTAQSLGSSVVPKGELLKHILGKGAEALSAPAEDRLMNLDLLSDLTKGRMRTIFQVINSIVNYATVREKGERLTDDEVLENLKTTQDLIKEFDLRLRASNFEARMERGIPIEDNVPEEDFNDPEKNEAWYKRFLASDQPRIDHNDDYGYDGFSLHADLLKKDLSYIDFDLEAGVLTKEEHRIQRSRRISDYRRKWTEYDRHGRHLVRIPPDEDYEESLAKGRFDDPLETTGKFLSDRHDDFLEEIVRTRYPGLHREITENMKQELPNHPLLMTSGFPQGSPAPSYGAKISSHYQSLMVTSESVIQDLEKQGLDLTYRNYTDISPDYGSMYKDLSVLKREGLQLASFDQDVVRDYYERHGARLTRTTPRKEPAPVKKEKLPAPVRESLPAPKNGNTLLQIASNAVKVLAKAADVATRVLEHKTDQVIDRIEEGAEELEQLPGKAEKGIKAIEDKTKRAQDVVDDTRESLSEEPGIIDLAEGDYTVDTQDIRRRGPSDRVRRITRDKMKELAADEKDPERREAVKNLVREYARAVDRVETLLDPQIAKAEAAAKKEREQKSKLPAHLLESGGDITTGRVNQSTSAESILGSLRGQKERALGMAEQYLRHGMASLRTSGLNVQDIKRRHLTLVSSQKWGQGGDRAKISLAHESHPELRKAIRDGYKEIERITKASKIEGVIVAYRLAEEKIVPKNRNDNIEKTISVFGILDEMFRGMPQKTMKEIRQATINHVLDLTKIDYSINPKTGRVFEFMRDYEGKLYNAEEVASLAATLKKKKGRMKALYEKNYYNYLTAMAEATRKRKKGKYLARLEKEPKRIWDTTLRDLMFPMHAGRIYDDFVDMLSDRSYQRNLEIEREQKEISLYPRDFTEFGERINRELDILAESRGIDASQWDSVDVPYGYDDENEKTWLLKRALMGANESMMGFDLPGAPMQYSYRSMLNEGELQQLDLFRAWLNKRKMFMHQEIRNAGVEDAAVEVLVGVAERNMRVLKAFLKPKELLASLDWPRSVRVSDELSAPDRIIYNFLNRKASDFDIIWLYNLAFDDRYRDRYRFKYRQRTDGWGDPDHDFTKSMMDRLADVQDALDRLETQDIRIPFVRKDLSEDKDQFDKFMKSNKFKLDPKWEAMDTDERVEMVKKAVEDFNKETGGLASEAFYVVEARSMGNSLALDDLIRNHVMGGGAGGFMLDDNAHNRRIIQEQADDGWDVSDMKLGRVYIVADAIADLEYLKNNILRHEATHYFLNRFMVDHSTDDWTERNKFLDQIYEEKAGTKLMNVLEGAYKDQDPGTATGRQYLANEYLAALAEDPEYDKGTWNRFVAWVRRMLRKLGVKLKYADNDLRMIIRSWFVRYRRENHPSGPDLAASLAVRGMGSEVSASDLDTQDIRWKDVKDNAEIIFLGTALSAAGVAFVGGLEPRTKAVPEKPAIVDTREMTVRERNEGDYAREYRYDKPLYADEYREWALRVGLLPGHSWTHEWGHDRKKQHVDEVVQSFYQRYPGSENIITVLKHPTELNPNPYGDRSRSMLAGVYFVKGSREVRDAYERYEAQHGKTDFSAPEFNLKDNHAYLFWGSDFIVSREQIDAVMHHEAAHWIAGNIQNNYQYKRMARQVFKDYFDHEMIRDQLEKRDIFIPVSSSLASANRQNRLGREMIAEIMEWPVLAREAGVDDKIIGIARAEAAKAGLADWDANSIRQFFFHYMKNRLPRRSDQKSGVRGMRRGDLRRLGYSPKDAARLQRQSRLDEDIRKDWQTQDARRKDDAAIRKARKLGAQVRKTESHDITLSKEVAPSGFVERSLDSVGRMAKRSLLSFVSLNNVPDFLPEGATSTRDFIRLVDEYMTEKTRNYFAVDRHVHELGEFVRDNPAEGELFFDLAFRSTLAGIDPTLSPDVRSRVPDITDPRYEDYLEGRRLLFKMYDALPEIGKRLYKENIHHAERFLNEFLAAMTESIVRRGMPKDKEEQAIQTLRSEILNRVKRPYAALTRTGDHYVYVRVRRRLTAQEIERGMEDGMDDYQVIGFKRFHTAREARQWAAKWNEGDIPWHFKNRDGVPYDGVELEKPVVGTYPVNDTSILLKKMDPKTFRDMLDVIKTAFGSEDGYRNMENSLWDMLISMSPGDQFTKHFLPRKGTPGYDPDLVKSTAIFHSRGGHMMAEVKFRDLLEEAFEGTLEELRGYADDGNRWAGPLADSLMQRYEFLKNPRDNKAVMWANKGFFNYFLAGIPPFNLAPSIINATHGFTYVAAVMAAEEDNGLWLQRFSTNVWEALKAGGNFIGWDGTFDKGAIDTLFRLKDPQEIEFMRDMINKGAMEITRATDLTQVGTWGTEEFTGSGSLQNTLSWSFHTSEKFARAMVLLASYRQGRKRLGMSHQEASDHAYRINKLGNFDYSNINRPPIMQKGALRAMFALQTFGFNMIYRHLRDAWDGFGFSKIKDKRQRRQARDRLMGMTIVSVLLAGISGSMLINGVMAAIEAFMKMLQDEEDEEWDPVSLEATIRSQMSLMFGPKMSDALWVGPITEYLGANIHSRVATSNMAWMGTQEVMEPTETLDYAVKQVGGVPYALAERFARGLERFKDRQDMQLEDYLAIGREWSPGFARGILTAMLRHRQGLTTRSGRPLVPPEDFTDLEKAMYAVGFSSDREADAYDKLGVLLAVYEHTQNRRRELSDRAKKHLTDALDAEEAGRYAKMRQAENAYGAMFEEGGPIYRFNSMVIRRAGEQEDLARSIGVQLVGANLVGDQLFPQNVASGWLQELRNKDPMYRGAPSEAAETGQHRVIFGSDDPMLRDMRPPGPSETIRRMVRRVSGQN